MQNGFEGVVNGLYTVPNCVMLDCGNEAPCTGGAEIMQSYCGGRLFSLMKEEDCKDEADNAVCKCHVLRLFGIGMVGGGVLCRVFRVLGNAGICFYGASVSECGIALALPRERLSEAVRLLAAEFLDDVST